MDATLSGYAVLWGEVSSDGAIKTHEDRFSEKTCERFVCGCFSEYLAGNHEIKAMLGHFDGTAFGWRSDGGLRVWEDRDGLGFEMDLPPYFSDLSPEENRQIRIRPKGVSIGFTPLEETWEPYHGGSIHIVRRAALREISIVTGRSLPALKTSVSVREVPFREWQLRRQVARDSFEGVVGLAAMRRKLELMKCA